MKIIGVRKIWYAISILTVGGSILALSLFGLKQGIDFTGGSLLFVRFDQRPTPEVAEKTLAEFNLGGMVIQPVGEQDMNFRMQSLNEETHQLILKKLADSFGTVTELQFNSIGPSVGKELRSKSLTALLIVFITILMYIAWVFRKVSAPVKSWKYGVVCIISAFHDIIIPFGLFAVLGKLYNVEIGTPFIAAVLTVMGYSINDTIVVFDRIRENLLHTSGSFEQIVENSVHQTLWRSVNSSVTTLLALLAVYLFGGASIKDFALALIVGVATGTYSSIFIASPLVVDWNNWTMRGRK